MKIDLLATYNVLGHEKYPTYAEAHGRKQGDLQDVVTVEIPEEYKTWKNETGHTVIRLEGLDYLLDEVLTNAGDAPALRIPGLHSRIKKLAVVD